ncbi:MAG: EamA family transporter, partial [Candidatus Micrarchaeota archaeon]
MLLDPYSLLPPLGWLVVSILATSAWSLLLRILMREEKDYFASIAFSEIFSIAFLASALFFLGANFGFSKSFELSSISLPELAIPLSSAILYTGFLYFTFKGSQTIEGSIRPILAQTQSIWAAILSILFLGEFFDLGKGVAILLIIAGSSLTAFEGAAGKFKMKGAG